MIATEWKEFKEIDWQIVYDNMTKPAFVFDGRLILDAEKLRKIGFRVSHSLSFPKVGDLRACFCIAGQADRPRQPVDSRARAPVFRSLSLCLTLLATDSNASREIL